MSKKMGRNTVYSNEVVAKTHNYIKYYEESNDVIPSVAGLAVHLGLSKSTLYNWAKEDGKEDFLDALKDLEGAQERELLNSGLNGTFNSTITKLILTKHKYSDKVDTTVKDITPKIIKDDIPDVPTPPPKQKE